MAKVLVCDACGNPTKRLVKKLFLGERTGKMTHSDYTHHADVGECCAARIDRIIRWQPRKKQGTAETKRQQHAA